MLRLISSLLLVVLMASQSAATGYIRYNQMGYAPNSVKAAVFISGESEEISSFQLYETLSGKLVFEGRTEAANPAVWGMKSAFRLNFSEFTQPGGYYLKAGNTISPSFRISADVYKGAADFVLNYMRQQRCGFNPYLNDSCHTNDGLIVDHPTRTGEHLDVHGGWHDASDYLQYTTTSANAVYQLLFAWQQNPKVYGDKFLANGRPGANGIPDILDEARWGLEWLLRMNPSKNEMYNQIADDRDHSGMRLPTADTLGGYGLGKYRPVYFVTGKSQGLGKHKNRTTGVSSTAAKFASSFALGALVFKTSDPLFAEQLHTKSLEAWDFAKSDLGVCQTACMVSPYFYEEDNYTDDMELAAATLARLDKHSGFQREAAYWGDLEPITPWIERHYARHYQYYPFVNLGHAMLAQSADSLTAAKFTRHLKNGLEVLQNYASDDPFRIGVPFIWCSNNLVAAAITQAKIYRKLSGDNSYLEMETALTDWLFGCNPWGTSMICELPAGGDYPATPHSALTYLLNKTTTGGLVDGPVYSGIFKSLIGIRLHDADEYAEFQDGKAVYHDDMGDYSTNEPTMDGTASLSYLLSSLESEAGESAEVIDSQGALIRMRPDSKTVYLIFSAHEYAEGASVIQQTLRKNRVKASFFFTGKFYADPENKQMIEKLIADGHYLGAHSDAHLLYADWNKRDSTCVSRKLLEEDLKANFDKMARFGLTTTTSHVYLPPYEWYNAECVDWCRQLGLKVISFTPGTITNADYTTPEMSNYRSSESIMKSIKAVEKTDPDGLNGSILLIHLGTAPERVDKFYNKLGELLAFLKKEGYTTANFAGQPTDLR